MCEPKAQAEAGSELEVRERVPFRTRGAEINARHRVQAGLGRVLSPIENLDQFAVAMSPSERHGAPPNVQAAIGLFRENRRSRERP